VPRGDLPGNGQPQAGSAGASRACPVLFQAGEPFEDAGSGLHGDAGSVVSDGDDRVGTLDGRRPYLALAVLGLGGVGVGSAVAGPAHTAPKAPAVTAPATPSATTPTDTDAVQSGDQSTPDVPGAVDAAEPAGTETKDTTGTPNARDTPDATGVADTADATDAADASTEKAGSKTADGTETGASDGNDGGHADPVGTDVNHVGGANEK